MDEAGVRDGAILSCAQLVLKKPAAWPARDGDQQVRYNQPESDPNWEILAAEYILAA